MKNLSKLILHGECMIFESALPPSVKRKNVTSKTFILADSETTGNHHVLDMHEGVKLFEGDGGVTFMETDRDTSVRCVQESRHDTFTLPAGTYGFDIQNEYDCFAARQQKVRD